MEITSQRLLRRRCIENQRLLRGGCLDEAASKKLPRGPENHSRAGSSVMKVKLPRGPENHSLAGSLVLKAFRSGRGLLIGDRGQARSSSQTRVSTAHPPAKLRARIDVVRFVLDWSQSRPSSPPSGRAPALRTQLAGQPKPPAIRTP